MKKEMCNRRVLVTGAGSGIGLATANTLYRHGARIAAVVQTEAQALAVSETIPDAAVFLHDLLHHEESALLPERAASVLGGLDGVACCAGIFFRGKSDGITLQHWQQTFDLNLTANFILIRAAIAHMRVTPAPNASVVAVSSQLGQVGYPNGPAYAASKAALDSLIKSLALEWAHTGIRINAVAPGPVRTAMTQAALMDSSARAAMIEGVPMGRVGEPSEIAEVMSFLLSERASFITGQILCADGGYTVR